MDDEQFAATTIRAARRRAEMSQRALALAAGVAPSVVCAYETGARQPSAKMLSRLMRAAGAQLAVVDPDDVQQLFDGLPLQVQWSEQDVDRAVRGGDVPVAAVLFGRRKPRLGD